MGGLDPVAFILDRLVAEMRRRAVTAGTRELEMAYRVVEELAEGALARWREDLASGEGPGPAAHLVRLRQDFAELERLASDHHPQTTALRVVAKHLREQGYIPSLAYPEPTP